MGGCYDNDMAEMSFQLDISSAQSVLTDLAAATVNQSAQAIAARAEGIAGSMSRDVPAFTVEEKVGTIVRGKRAIATVIAAGSNAHENYIGLLAIQKAKDAGRI